MKTVNSIRNFENNLPLILTSIVFELWNSSYVMQTRREQIHSCQMHRSLPNIALACCKKLRIDTKSKLCILTLNLSTHLCLIQMRKTSKKSWVMSKIFESFCNVWVFVYNPVGTAHRQVAGEKSKHDNGKSKSKAETPQTLKVWAKYKPENVLLNKCSNGIFQSTILNLFLLESTLVPHYSIGETTTKFFEKCLSPICSNETAKQHFVPPYPIAPNCQVIKMPSMHSIAFRHCFHLLPNSNMCVPSEKKLLRSVVL